jgi:ribonuclease HII
VLLNYLNKNIVEAGVDEAGRGCLAGPVVAAAVILPIDFYHPLLNDSKQVNEKSREELSIVIKKEAIGWAVGWASAEEIDKINILQATYLAMHRAIAELKLTPQYLIIDGNRFKPYQNISHTTIIKGDGKYASIAAASILAKTARDFYMKEIHLRYPQYNWIKNKGYGTLEHRILMEKHGLCELHRKSFKLKEKQMKLF